MRSYGRQPHDIHDINDAGDIVGESLAADGTSHAFFGPFGGPMIDLGPIAGGSVAYGLNNAGQVVGTMLVASRIH
jgi:probable HAF family extracellular repeat protein